MVIIMLVRTTKIITEERKRKKNVYPYTTSPYKAYNHRFNIVDMPGVYNWTRDLAMPLLYPYRKKYSEE